MHKVLLVDDEPWILRGLAREIPWEELDLELCGQTTDSVSALSIILNRQPDIVITDIQMPNVSGLDLMRCSREQGHGCEFIIFSGYSDFEYARRAIQYGVFAYLLKPLDQKELTRTLRLLVRNIRTKRDAFHEQSEALFLDGRLRVSPAQFEGAREACVLTCYLTYSDKLLLDRELADIPRTDYKLGSDKYVYLLRGEPAAVRVRLERMLKSASCANKEYLFFGLSDSIRSAEEFPAALRISDAAAHNHFIRPERRIFGPTESNIARCNDFLRQVYQAVDGGTTEQAVLLVEEELKELCRREVFTVQDLSYIYNRILAHMGKDGESGYEVLSYDQLAVKYAGVQEAAGFLGQVIRDADLRPGLPESHGSLYEAFGRMLDYIDHNYNQEISLSDLSLRFYINMTYICDLFKKYKSTTFLKYLTSLRMDRARQLICESAMPLADVAEAVGYRDYYYFIKQFKRRYGATPGQLRKETPPAKERPPWERGTEEGGRA